MDHIAENQIKVEKILKRLESFGTKAEEHLLLLQVLDQDGQLHKMECHLPEALALFYQIYDHLHRIHFVNSEGILEPFLNDLQAKYPEVSYARLRLLLPASYFSA